MQRRTLLVIDDEENMRHVLASMLRKEGYDVSLAADGVDGLQRIAEQRFDFILCDIKMPRMDGLEFLKNLQGTRNPAIIITMSAYGTLDLAIETMQLGAYDYISKPFKPAEIILTLKKAEERERLQRENVLLREEVQRKYNFQNLIGKSAHMMHVCEMIKKIAQHKSPVLITGESGTGKELVAKAIHYNGTRSPRSFLAVNCGAIPENLLESELFGHVKGSFTGAIKDKVGRFEMADGGTVFLDEIGDLSPNVQVKLLRFLQQKEFERVGDTRSIKVNVRVIAATHRNLMDRVEQGSFRKDLYYRLKVVEVLLPSLRERREDIPLLVEHFRARFVLQFHKNILHVAEDVYKTFLAYSWPGNIRELEHVMEHAFVVCDGAEITVLHLPQEFCVPSPSVRVVPVKATVLHCSEDDVRRALEKTAWNKAKAARILGVGRQTLYRKLIEYNIAEPADE